MIKKRKLSVVIIALFVLPILIGFLIIKIFWLESVNLSKFGIDFGQNTKFVNENNNEYLTKLIKKCNLQAYTEDFYVNSDTQLIGKITSIEFEENRTKLGIGGKSVFNINNNLIASKSLQKLDSTNKQLDEISLNEFSAKEIIEVLIPGNWIRMDKGPSGPATLIVYCHE